MMCASFGTVSHLATDTLACEKGNSASLPTRSLARKETVPRHRHARLRERKQCEHSVLSHCFNLCCYCHFHRSLARKEAHLCHDLVFVRQRGAWTKRTLTLPTTTNTVNTATKIKHISSLAITVFMLCLVAHAPPFVSVFGEAQARFTWWLAPEVKRRCRVVFG